MYRYEPEQYSVKAMRGFVESWHRNVKAEIVPVEPSALLVEISFLIIHYYFKDSFCFFLFNSSRIFGVNTNSYTSLSYSV